MEKNAANDIVYYLMLDEANKEHLASIRHWSNLKAATDAGKVWIKDLDYAQINSVEVKSIPYKVAFYSRGQKLFLLNSNLPDRTIPSLLWTPIDRAFPIKLPSFNHNYFGINEKLEILLTHSNEEQETVAMITQLDTLQNYIQTAPAARLRKIRWTILNGDIVLLFGAPLLPVDGDVFWRRGNALLPAGYDMELHALVDSVYHMLDPEGDSFVLWRPDNTYALINKNDLQPLSLGSFRMSTQQHNRPSHEQ